MSINLNKSLSDLTAELPGAARVFERLGLDYCCGGGKLLTEACAAANLAPDYVAGLLVEAATTQNDFIDWRSRPLGELIDYILETHHVYTREELARLTPLFAKVINAHGGRHPELINLRNLFIELTEELIPHLFKEEEVLFPYIRRLEWLEQDDAQTSPPRACFGTVGNPVRVMTQEHERAGELLREIRALSGEFNPPEDACRSYQALFQALLELEQDLHRHIHLENNILFPRAIELEERMKAAC